MLVGSNPTLRTKQCGISVTVAHPPPNRYREGSIPSSHANFNILHVVKRNITQLYESCIRGSNPLMGTKWVSMWTRKSAVCANRRIVCLATQRGSTYLLYSYVSVV